MNEEIELEEYAPWLVVGITLIGAFLRAFMLNDKGMWLDETFSVWLAGHSVPDMLQWIVKIDQHPPLYYLLLHFWIALWGDTPHSTRLLSAILGAATIPIIYLIGKRMSGAPMGLAAAVFLAFSLFNIYYGQEARMYTLLAFNAAVAVYALVRLLTDARAVTPVGSQVRNYIHVWRTAGPAAPDPKAEFSYRDAARAQSGWRAWVARHRWLPLDAIATDLAWLTFVVFTVATMLTHNTAVFLPLAANLFVLGLMVVQRLTRADAPPSLQAPSLGNWVKAQIAVFVLWSPWLVFFVRQSRAVYARFWIPAPTWDGVVQVVKSLLYPSAPLPTGQAMVIWILYGVVLCLGVLHFRKQLARLAFLVTLFAVPFLGELLVSIRRPIFYDRTLIWTTIPLFLLLGAGIAQLRFRFLTIAAVGILATFSLFAAGDYYRFYQKEDWSTAAGYVAKYAEEGDLVLFNSNFVEIPFNYYFRAYEDLYHIQVEKQGVPQDLLTTGRLEPEMTVDDVPDLRALVRDRDRVWLVYSHDSYTDPTGLIPQTLAAQMELTQQRDFYGGQVQLYEAP
ncbi:MAG: glycosyltransferase family 39 protein [Caldilineaceae bacterium]|nr:glycosyltransferase family 39 protein [Caldilineaceae bacterium]